MRFVRLRDFAADRNGGATMEYAILAAGIGLTLAMTVSLLGDRMMTTYGKIDAAIIVADGGPDDPPPCPPGNKNKNNNKGKKNGKPSCES